MSLKKKTDSINHLSRDFWWCMQHCLTRVTAGPRAAAAAAASSSQTAANNVGQKGHGSICHGMVNIKHYTAALVACTHLGSLSVISPSTQTIHCPSTNHQPTTFLY
mmetsp:Transcript_21574/g.54941  ORF Transcript_21574/g.54941 Transcript_21574/m.54941 type:complete len:106 (+) Transcript_21574:408-725(+)